jgi:hypothetical protein
MLVGLGYQARVGKGCVAEWLVKRHGFVEVAFADALKAACRIIFGLTHAQLYGEDKDREDAFWRDTPRNILQLVGTECLRRGYRDDVWVKALQRGIEANPGRDYVVSDMRFQNEAAAIETWGGKLVRIMRPDAPQIATGNHASELALAGWGDWDYTLCNDGTLDELHAKVDIMLEGFRGKQ